MSIDWDATGSMIQGWGTLLGAGAVIYAAKRGADTFESWKQQKVAERRQEQAELILTSAYNARRALRYVREPMMWGHELSAAEEKLREDEAQWAQQTDARRKRLVTAQAYFNRLNKTSDEQRELSTRLPMARALFGEELEQALEDLRHQFWIVQVDVESYIDDECQNAQFTRQIRRGMYDVKPPEGEVNEVSSKIEAAVSTIERICQPALILT